MNGCALFVQEQQRAAAATRFRLQMPPLMNVRPRDALRTFQTDENLLHFSSYKFAFVDTSPGLRPFVYLRFSFVAFFVICIFILDTLNVRLPDKA